MSIDYSTEDPIRRYITECTSFLRLPLMTRAIAVHLRRLVEPVHGWARIRADRIIEDLRNINATRINPDETELFQRAIRELEAQGYLTRIRVLDEPFDDFRLADGRNVPLSQWTADPHGPWLVITDWVPSEHRLTAEETLAWHELRQDRASWVLEAGQPTEAEKPAPIH